VIFVIKPSINWSRYRNIIKVVCTLCLTYFHRRVWWGRFFELTFYLQDRVGVSDDLIIGTLGSVIKEWQLFWPFFMSRLQTVKCFRHIDPNNVTLSAEKFHLNHEISNAFCTAFLFSAWSKNVTWYLHFIICWNFKIVFFFFEFFSSICHQFMLMRSVN
jgi:hypothetical protein